MYRYLEPAQESTEDVFSRFSYEVINANLSDHLLDFQERNIALQSNDASDSGEVSTSTGSNDDLLLQIQVTNNLLSISIALQFFIFVFMLIQFFIKVVKNNITNFFD